LKLIALNYKLLKGDKKMVNINVVVDQDKRCDANGQDPYLRGVTTWESSDFFLQPRNNTNDTKDLSFTCTVPKCYNNDTSHADQHYYGMDSCNVSFKAMPYPNSVSSDIQIGIEMFNDTPGNGDHQYTINSPFPADSAFFSGNRQHPTRITFELCNASDPDGVKIYRDIGKNTIRLRNYSDATVIISDFKINRIYKIMSPNVEVLNYCNGSPGSSGDSVGNDGTLDVSSRQDYPCNCESCGRKSITNAHGSISSNQRTIPDNTTYTFVLDWTNYSGGNYDQKYKCLFNFNDLRPENDTANDANLSVSLNNQYYTTIYLGKTAQHKSFPGLDLTEALNGNSSYNDAGYNTISITNNSGVDVRFWDSVGINVYRVYQTTPVYTITVSYGSGGTISPDDTPVNAGGSQAFTITPNTGYVIDSVIIDSTSYGGVSSYTFYSVSSNHTISATFRIDSCQFCNAACQFFCVTCDACYGSCQGCQDPCEASCQGCDSYVPCQSCDSCEGCYACNPCQGCQPCETCYSCASCYEDCYEACYEGCYGG
jgi:hypothetical protein